LGENQFFCCLSIGIIASISTYFPIWIDYWFVISYLVFYTWFVIRFSNHVTKIDFYLSATTSKPEQIVTTAREPKQLPPESPAENDPTKEVKLKNSLEQWVLNGGYMRGDISTEEVAKLLGYRSIIFFAAISGTICRLIFVPGVMNCVSVKPKNLLPITPKLHSTK